MIQMKMHSQRNNQKRNHIRTKPQSIRTLPSKMHKMMMMRNQKKKETMQRQLKPGRSKCQKMQAFQTLRKEKQRLNRPN